MSLVGSPTASRMIASVKTPPAGIPAAPTLDAVAVTLTQKEKMTQLIVIQKKFFGLFRHPLHHDIVIYNLY